MNRKELPIEGNFSPQSIREIEHPLMLKDIWDGEKDLQIRVNQHTRHDRTINFGYIHQDWFKQVVKYYLLYRCSQGKSFATLLLESKALRYFARFLEAQCVCSFEDITDEILSTYLSSMVHLAEKTKNNRLQPLNRFFELGTMNSWFNIKTYWFKKKMIRVKPSHDKINYIPDEVLKQLDEHLHLLPEPLQRAVLLFRTLGLRASELLQMKFDCLRQRRDNQWEIHFTNWKFNEESDVLPIVPEIAKVIKEQQQYIRHHVGKNFQYLFCGSAGSNEGLFNPKPKVMSLQSFNQRLNNLAKQYSICDKSGRLWQFNSHQFRRTIATTMTNAGVRQYIIQCYLRHLDPNMMQHYAHISPETEKKEIEKLHKQKKIVDITGAEVSINHPELENNIGLQWLRSKMQPKALAMGFCARPQLLKPCPHASACMSCGHFRLDEDDLLALIQHLERTQQLKTESQQLGYIRQLKGIEEDEAKLIKLIQHLKENDE